MPQSFIQGAVTNVGLLAIACLIVLTIGYRFKLRPTNPTYKFIIGLTFGLIATAVIRFPLVVEGGAVLDTRAVPTVLAGFFGGPISGIVCGLMAAVSRILVGGDPEFVIFGTIGIAVFVSIGIVAGAIHRKYIRSDPGVLTFLALAAATVLIWFPTNFIALPFERVVSMLNAVLLVYVIGNAIGIVVLGLAYQTVRDLIEQKNQLEKALAVSDLAREAAGIGVWQLKFDPALDPEKARIEWDDHLIRLHGFEPSQFQHSSDEWRAATNPDDAEQVSKAFLKAQAGGTVFSSRYRTGGQQSGKWRWAQTYGRFAEDPDTGQPMALGLTWEVTDEEEAKRERDIALQESVELNSRLNAFARTASHDLQEPLRKMTILADVAMRSVNDGDDLDAQEQLKRIQSVSRSARTLVKDLLDFSRAPNAELKRERFAVGPAIAEAVDMISEAAREGGVEISLPDQDIVILADRPKFLRLMANFLSNAVKYRKTTGTPKVWIELCAKPETDSVELCIRDNGIGFDAKQTDKLFQPFVRLHNTPDAKGSGIGLSICKLFCVLHGWTLNAFSQTGGPTEFIIAIPNKDVVSETA